LEFDSGVKDNRFKSSAGSSNADDENSDERKNETHLFSLQVKAKNCRVLMQTKVKEVKNISFT
jgi:hypothetical protein